MERIGPYTVLGELGRGGMGVVYHARHEELGSEVALKVISDRFRDDPGVVARFQREARAAARLAGHPGIVGVHDVGDADGRPYLIMEFVRGRALDEVIESGELRPEEIASILEQVARAVHHAHGQGVLHRDLKPANILIDAQGRPHVTDFGLAQTRAVDEKSRRLTQTGEMLGTPSYMAPEQARGESLDARADVYALGATLFEACAGRPPFDSPSMHGVLHGLLTEPPPPLRRLAPHTPAALEAIAERCLAKRPSDRYATAEALADDLARFQRGEVVEARTIGLLERLRRGLRRRRALVAATTTAIVVVGAAAGVWQWNTRAHEDRRQVDADERTADASFQRAAAWFELAGAANEPMRLLEDHWHGTPLADGAVSAALDAVRAACEAEAGRHPASRLGPVWLVLARIYADQEPDPAAAFARVRPELEADPVCGLVEAQYWLGRYVRTIQPREFSFGSGGARAEAFTESAAQRRWRERGADALRRAIGSPELARSPTAAALRALAQGAAAFAAGSTADAARHLQGATGDPTVGRLAGAIRGLVLFRLKHFEDSGRQLQELLAGGWLTVRRLGVAAWLAAAEAASARGEDPEPFLHRAQAITGDPMGGGAAARWFRRMHVMVLWSRGTARRASGGDAFEPWNEAIATLDALEASAPSEDDHARLRAAVLTQMGRAAYHDGRDGEPFLRDALAAHDAAVAGRDDPRLRRERGDAWRELAAGLAARGADPGPAIAAALADLDYAVQHLQGEALALRLRGIVHLERFVVARDAGADATDAGAAAIADLEAAVARAPNESIAHYDLARARDIVARAAQWRGGDPSAGLASALEGYRTAVRLNPRNASAWLRLGELHLLIARQANAAGTSIAEHHAAAVRALTDSTKANPTNWELYASLGVAQTEIALIELRRGVDSRERARAGVSALSRAIELNPGIARSWSGRADARRALGETEALHGGNPLETFRRGIADAQQGANRAADSSHASNAVGVVAMSASRTIPEGPDHSAWRSLALGAFSRALELEPDWTVPAGNRGLIQLDIGRAAHRAGRDPEPHWRAGIAQLHGMIERHPREATLWGNRGLLRHDLANWHARNGGDPRPLLLACATDAETACRLDAGNVAWLIEASVSRYDLGFAVLAAGGDGHSQWELAWDHARAVLRISPSFWKAHLLAGRVRAAQGRLEEALSYFEEAAKTQPTLPDVVNAIAQIKRALGK